MPKAKLAVYDSNWRVHDGCDPSNWGATCTLNHGRAVPAEMELGFNVAVVMSYPALRAARASPVRDGALGPRGRLRTPAR